MERFEEPVAARVYRQVGVRLWGGGAYEREPLDGGDTKYKTLNRTENGDIIVNKIWARHGSVSVVLDGLEDCYVSGEFPLFQPRPERLDPRWFYWITKTPWFWSRCDEKSRGTSGKNRIRPEQFLAIPIPLPPLAEQRRIVAKIEQLAAKIDEARGLRREAVVESENLVGSYAHKLFGEELAATAPTVRLGDVSEIRSGVTLGRELSGPTIELPYLRVANVQDGYLDLLQIKRVQVHPDERLKWQLREGDLLLTEGGDWDKLGRGTIWHDEVPDCIHQNHIFRIRLDPGRFDPGYVLALTRSPFGKEYFQEASKQTTNLASINQRQLKAFPVYQLSLKAQRSIVANLEGLQEQVDRLKSLQQKTAAELDALLPSILDKAFKGEL